MRDLILKMSVSIDGYVGGSHGELDWLFRTMGEDLIAWQTETLSQAGLHVMGRRTFRDMAAFYPTSTEPYALPMNEIPKVYFSKIRSAASTTRAFTDAQKYTSTRTAADGAGNFESWDRAPALSGDLAEEIARLKAEPGDPILAHGGASFANSLMRGGLIDEYRLLMHPVALGAGLALFEGITSPTNLSLMGVRTFDKGVVLHIYRSEPKR
jgi:dihydrofolate reductase